ncbi:MAG: 16S rRNA (cytidine1402-2'-O)-methyltransferase [Alphaproteobacteria bacterium]
MNKLTGILYIVPTPIGNLSDMSTRAIDILQDVDLIAAEDTRHSGHLLQHFLIKTRTVSLHDHNEQQRTQLLIKKLQEGENIALISDAGTPLISDPGYTLVSTCRSHNITVIAVPGPCALTTALCASGLPTDRFMFLGFLPVKQKAKAESLKFASVQHMTCIFYEAPRRIKDTIEVCGQVLPSNHQIVLAKELSKRFETYICGTAEDVLAWLTEEPAHQKGEFVLMIYCKMVVSEELPSSAKELLHQLTALLPPKSAAAVVSEHYKLNKKTLYQYTLSVKEQA